MDALAARVERIEAEAWARLQLALPADLAAHVGVRVLRRGTATLLAASGADVATLNRVIGLGFDHALSADELTSIQEWFGDAGVRRWLVEWSPQANPANADQLLVRHGGVSMTPTAKLHRELDDLPELRHGRDVVVVEIGPDDALRYQATVAGPLGVPDVVAPGIRSTIGEPGWHFYLACDAGTPIAGGALFISGDGAWLGLAATSAEARRRGAQSALLHRRLHDARRIGCRWGAAETRLSTDDQPNPSLRNMLRVGFEVLYHRPKYLFGGLPAA